MVMVTNTVVTLLSSFFTCTKFFTCTWLTLSDVHCANVNLPSYAKNQKNLNHC